MSSAEDYLKKKSIFYDLISKEPLSEKIVDKRIKADLSKTIGYSGRYFDGLKAVRLARKEGIEKGTEIGFLKARKYPLVKEKEVEVRVAKNIFREMDSMIYLDENEDTLLSLGKNDAYKEIRKKWAKSK